MIRSKSPAPKKKTKAQLEKEKTQQDLIAQFIAAGMDPDAIAKVMESENIKTEEENSKTEEVKIKTEEKKIKTEEDGDWAKTFVSTVQWCSGSSNFDYVFNACVMTGIIYVLCGNPDGALLLMYLLTVASGWTIYYAFDKKSADRPAMVMFAALLIFFGLYGVSTEKHYRSEESFKNSLRKTEAAETLNLCHKALEAEIEMMNKETVEKTLHESPGWEIFKLWK